MDQPEIGNNWKQGTDEEGNTKSSSSRVIPSKFWCFTLNNYTLDQLAQLETSFESNKIKYVIGKEVAPSTGTNHLQGFIMCGKKIRPVERFRTISNAIHWERCLGSNEQNITYCTKGNDYVCNFKIKKPIKLLNPADFYPWQKEVIKIIEEEPDDRTIHWFWEKTGCTGKTTFCKYLSKVYKAIPLDGKKNDILYMAFSNPSELYIWDIERSIEDYISYSALEKIKNGYYCSGKYEGGIKVDNCPHVVCFANFQPDESQLSRDRWNIVEIKKECPPPQRLLELNED